MRQPAELRQRPAPRRADLLAAALIDPSTYSLERHDHGGEHLPWLAIADDLPKHDVAPD